MVVVKFAYHGMTGRPSLEKKTVRGHEARLVRVRVWVTVRVRDRVRVSLGLG